MAGTGPAVWSRRRFLANLGWTGAVASLTVAARPATRPLMAAGPVPVREASATAAAALQTLTRDTFNGLAAWVVPGPDPFSVAQGMRTVEPGGVDAAAGRFLQEGLDGLLAYPDEVVAPLVESLARAIRDAGGPDAEPGSLDRDVDDALEAILANDATVPVSGAVALLLNLTAAQVDPSATVGPFPASPYANLAWDDKTEVHRRIEEDQHGIVELLDRDADEPTRAAVSGLLDFAGAAIIHFTAFGAYSEYHAFDTATGEATERPIGWELTGYAPGRRTPADGWDEFKGYHRGMRTFARRSTE